MASRIQGITIEIDGNTTKLQSALKDVNGKLRDTQTSLKDVNKLLKLDPNNTTLLEQKQKLLASAIDDTKKKLETEKEALAQLKAADQSPEVEAQMQALERQIIADEQALQGFTDEMNNMGAAGETATASISEKLETAGGKITAVGEGMKSVGESLTKNVTAPIMAAGAASIAAFNDVDSAMDTVIAKTGATGEAADALKESVENIATTIPTSFETAGVAVGDVATRFGLTGQELEDLSTRFIQFAELNNTDVSTAVENTQKALSAFGLGADSAEALLDRLNVTGQQTGISVDTLASGLVTNAAAFQEMGLNIDQAVNFMGQMEKSGADTSTVMGALQKALKNATDEGVPLDQALEDLQSTIQNGTGDVDGLTAAYELFGKSGASVYEAVKNGSLDFTNLAGAVDEATGSVSETFTATQDPLDQWQTTLNELKLVGADLGATLGEILQPILEQIGEVVQTLREKWEALSPEQQAFIEKAIMIAAVVGPIIGIIGSIITGIGGLITAIGTISAALAPMAATIGGVLAAAAPVVAVIAGIVAAGVLLYQNWDKIKEVAANVKEAVVNAWNNLKTSVTETMENIKTGISNAWDSLKTGVTNAAESIKSTVSEKWNNMKTNMSNAMDTAKSAVGNSLDAMKTAYSNAGGGISGIVEGLMSGVQSLFTSGLETLNSLTGGKLDGLVSFFTDKFNGIHEFVSGIVDKLKGIFDFDWSLPSIKLPHFSWSWKDLGHGIKLPNISVSWYRKAYDTPYLFNSPTVVNSGSGLRGFGDGNGGEVVYGRRQLMRDIAQASGGGATYTINVYASDGMDVNELADKVQSRLALLQKQKEAAYA